MKVLIADDHAVVRRGLMQILKDKFPEITIGEAATAQETLEQVWNDRWDVVVLDISMPGRSGLDALKEIKTSHPKVPVLILSIESERQFGVRVIKAGAAGFLNKDSAPETLVCAVRKLLSGHRYISPSLAEQLANDAAHGSTVLPHERLSDREFEILLKITSGNTVGQIAEAFGLSVKTVSTHRTRILEKMGMVSNAELTHYAMIHNLFSRDDSNHDLSR